MTFLLPLAGQKDFQTPKRWVLSLLGCRLDHDREAEIISALECSSRNCVWSARLNRGHCGMPLPEHSEYREPQFFVAIKPRP